jgi:hypothetical protein
VKFDQMSCRQRLRLGSWVLLAFCLAGISGTAQAQFALSDLQVAGRALGFLEKPLTGEIKVGIVYTSANPHSFAEAQDIQTMLGGGLRVGNVTLSPVLVPLTDVSGTDVALFFLTEGVGSEAMRTAEAARSKRALCITTDLPQVTSGVCAMGVRSQPKVEILVNRAAAARTGMSFSAVFRMMITEI